MLKLYSNIKNRRLELGISQEELAKKMGYKSRSTIAKIEAGVVDISQSKIVAFANALETTVSYLLDEEKKEINLNSNELEEIKDYFQPITKQYQVPIYGYVAGGIPIDYIETSDYEIVYVDEDTYNRGDLIALRVTGDSMYPLISDGDIAIIRKQNTFDNGDICIVWIDYEGGVIKKVKKDKDGLHLISYNENYETRTFSNKDLQTNNVYIQGKLIEIRRKF